MLWNRPSLRELCARHLRERAPDLKPKTLNEYRRLWEHDILPGLGQQTSVTALEPSIVRAWHLALADRGNYIANRALNVLAAAMTLAEAWGLVKRNPCRGISRFKESKRRRFFSCGELTAFGEVLAELEHETKVSAASADAVRLLFLTGCRRNEVLALAWSPVAGAAGVVDLEAGVVQLFDSKEGADVVTLPAAAVELLRRRRVASAGPWVFPGHKRGTHLAGLQRAFTRAREAGGLVNVRVHDSRRTFASAVLNAGEPLDRVGELLRHHDINTTRGYAYLETPARRKAAEAAGSVLAPLIAARRTA